MTEITAQVFSSSDILESNVFEVENAKSTTIKIKPEVKLLSKVNVVVYYITEDGEIISDSLSVNYEKDFINKVSFYVISSVSHLRQRPASAMLPV